jgi:hypothetical protein
MYYDQNRVVKLVMPHHHKLLERQHHVLVKVPRRKSCLSFDFNSKYYFCSKEKLIVFHHMLISASLNASKEKRNASMMKIQ